jgi:hypothetical protein
MPVWIVKNWKTSLAGVSIIAIGAAHTFLGVDIPGALDFYASLPVGMGLVLAKDANA